MRVRKKIDLELHLKINVLKIKRYIWCNIVHQSGKKTPFRKCKGMEFHNCMQRPILFVPDYSSHYENLEIKSTNIAANIP